MVLVSKFLRDTSGTTAIEYAVIATGIGVVLVAAVASIGTTLNTTFTDLGSALK